MLVIVMVLNLLCCLSIPHVALSSQAASPRDEREAANRIWEQAVAAKGGRERLHAVTNMVISTTGEYGAWPNKKRVRREELLELPNKYWFFDDYRPAVFGVRISMYNYDTMRKYIVTEGNPQTKVEPITETQKKKALRNNQLSFLLESRSLKPTLVKASQERIGRREVDVVQTIVAGERVDFAFDRKTHLPVQVSYFDIFEGKEYVNIQSFSDYVEVGGIKVPQKISYDDGSKYRATFKFNVDYNEDIFVKPASISAGPEGWMVKR